MSQKEKIDFLLSKLVDGLIVFPSDATGEDLRGIPVPVVCIDQLTDARNCDYVIVGNAAATFEATEHLIGQGHTDIGLLCGPAVQYTAKERLAGYVKAHKKYDIAIRNEYIIHTEHLVQSGYAAAKKIIGKANRPTALFATNYELTMGAVIALNELDIDIPDDVSFIGFDSLDLAKVARPSLSIVVQPTAEIGIKAAETLLRKMMGQKSDFDITELPLSFIKQKSVKQR